MKKKQKSSIGNRNFYTPQTSTELTIRNESLHQDCNDNGVRMVKFATSKYLVVKSMMFRHQNIHKYIWPSTDRKTHNQTHHILIDWRRHSSLLDVQCSRGADCDTLLHGVSKK